MRIPIVSDLTDRLTGKKPDSSLDDPIYLPSPLPAIDLAQFAPPLMEEERNRISELNLKVESKEEMIAFIRGSGLSVRCKGAFIGVVNTYYDRNVLLTDLTGKKMQGGTSSDEQVQIAYWRAKIDVMGVVRCNAWKSDRLNPEFTQIEQLILSQIWYRLKRTKGKDRESIISRRIHIEYNANQKIGKPDRKDE